MYPYAAYAHLCTPCQCWCQVLPDFIGAAVEHHVALWEILLRDIPGIAARYATRATMACSFQEAARDPTSHLDDSWSCVIA